ncbi:lytic enzyme [Pseudomonas phage ER16]|nr:lytic enzyme [Pseudomonas phage ER16]
MSAQRTGVAVAQAVLRFAGNEKISVDGAVGKQTQSALARVSADVRSQATAAVRAATGLDINDLIPKIVEATNDFGQLVPISSKVPTKRACCLLA